jgi:hypothetical protein
MEYEYRDFPIRIFKNGEFVLQDLEMYQREHEKDGWQFLGMVTLPSSDPEVGEVVYRFRRSNEPQ